jgi:hypothetical protein
MTINDFRQITFGVCFRIEEEIVHHRIPIDDTVRVSLVDMRNDFCTLYDGIEGDPEQFSPSEKYGTTEKLFASLTVPYLFSLNNLYHHHNAPVNSINLSDYLSSVEYYYSEFIHNNGAKTIGVKRPNQFKALLKKRVIRLTNDTLRAVEDDIFKLDNDFDVLIHEDRVEILHPAGFIFISDLEGEILTGVIDSANQIGAIITWLDFQFIGQHIAQNNARRAAKLIASIKSRNDLHHTDQFKLTEKCAHLGIPLNDNGGGLLTTSPDRIVDLLEVLDRRSYEYDITVNNTVEIYVAASRKQKR